MHSRCCVQHRRIFGALCQCGRCNQAGNEGRHRVMTLTTSSALTRLSFVATSRRTASTSPRPAASRISLMELVSAAPAPVILPSNRFVEFAGSCVRTIFSAENSDFYPNAPFLWLLPAGGEGRSAFTMSTRPALRASSSGDFPWKDRAK